jgi:hypothetical protein
MRRHTGRRLLDVELEAHAALQFLRQRGDHADQFDVVSFQSLRQFVRQAQMRETRCPDETDARRAAGQQNRCHGTP